MKIIKRIYIFIFILICLSGCGTREFLGFEKKKIKLEGKRISILKANSDEDQTDNVSTKTIIDIEEKIINWEQSYNSPTHLSINFKTSSNLKKIKNIVSGAGESGESKIISQPVVINDNLFFLDAKGNVFSFDLKKQKVIWKHNITLESEKDHNLGGGIAIYEDRVIINTAYGEIISLDIMNGTQVWKRSIDIPFRSASTIFDNKILSLTISNKLYVLGADTGEVFWEHEGLVNNTTLIGNPKVAADQNIVIVPYSNGDYYALNITNGKLIWKNSFFDLEQQETSNSFKDIDAYPVIKKDIVIVSSSIGKVVAINKKNGNRFWTKDIFSSQTPAVNGNSIFIVNNNKEMLCLDLITGGIRWSTELVADLSKNYKYIWLSPVIINSKIVLVGGNKKMLIIDPIEGKIERIQNLPSFPSSSPFVVNNLVYLMLKSGDVVQIE